MALLFSFFWFLPIFITSVLVKPSQFVLSIDPINHNYADLSSLPNKLSLTTDRTQDAVNRFRCPKGWQRFGGSCYYLSNTTSPPHEANQTCNLIYLNTSQLMQIRHPVELFYAAHIIDTNDLSALVIEINSHLFKAKLFTNELSVNDEIGWQSAENNFRKVRLNYDKRTKKFCQSRREGNFYDENPIDHIICTQPDSQSTNRVADEKGHSKKDDINSFSNDDDSKQFDDIRKVCDQFAWNLLDNNSTIFLLSKYVLSNKIICSITDIDPDINYQHMCQHVLDFCFDNNQCGKHGRCVNSLVSFKCSCYPYMDGPFCQEISKTFRQLLIGLFIIVFILVTLEIKLLQKYQRLGFEKLYGLVKTPSCTSNQRQVNENTSEGTVPRMLAPENETQESNVVRWLLVFGLMLVILCLPCIIPTIYHWTSFQLNNIDPSKFDLLVNDAIRMINQCKYKSILQIDNRIFIVFSGILCLVFYFLMKAKNCQCESCLSPIEPFAIKNRYETAALTGIVMIEVLMSLENFLIDISELWTRGVLEQFLDRALVPLLYSIRYYPIFVSLQQRDRYVSCLAFIYIAGNITYMIIRRCSCMDFLPLSPRFSTLDQAKRRLELGNWAIIYGLFKNAPQFILLSYIGAELTVRFFYDSILSKKKTNKEPESPITPGNEFDMHSSASSFEDLPNNDNLSSTCWSKICKFIGKIYQWDKDFPFSTMATCAYTVAFVLLFYLTCMFAFQPIVKTSSMSFLIFCLEQILNIDIDEWSFHKEIVFSAIFTMMILSSQLFIGMKNYRKHAKQLKEDNYKDIPPASELEPDSQASESVRYLGFVFLNVVGGFFIWFHIVLFIVTICSLFSFHAFTFEIYRLELILSLTAFIGPVLVLYGLKSSITRWICIFTTSSQSEDTSTMFNNKVYANLVYLTLIFSCHIAIFSSVFRLTKGILLNILLMPRFDYSYFGRVWEKHDSGYMTYVSYLHMEKAYRQPTQPEPISIDTNRESVTLTLPSVILTSVTLPSDQIRVTNEEDDEDTDDSANTTEEEAGGGDSYDTPTAEELDEADDASSVASSKYLRGEIRRGSSKSMVPTSPDVEYVPSKSQQCLTDSSPARKAGEQRSTLEQERHHYDPKRKPKYVSTSNEQQLLMSSTPTDSEEEEEEEEEDEDRPPKLPLKNYKPTTMKSHNIRFNSRKI